jgi:ATP-dependent protease Clp ATPase subunit
MTPQEEVDLLKQVATRDLLDYGFESEFIGRLPVTVTLNELDEESLYTILRNENCAVIQAKKREFQAYGIDLEFGEVALRLLAKRAAAEKTGARGLLSVIEQSLIKFEKRLPTAGVDKLRVTEKLIKDPVKVLNQVLFDHAVQSYAAEFEDQTGVKLSFHKSSLARLGREQQDSNINLREYLQEQLKDYIYGVKLLGVSEFEVTEAMLDDPGGILDRLIKASYDKKGSKKAGN